DDAVDEVRVVALDLQVEAMGRPRRGLDVALQDARGDGPEVLALPQLRDLERWVPGEPSPLTRMELVVEGRVKIRRDQRVQPGTLLGVEPEASTVVARPPDAEPLAQRQHARARLANERLVVEDSLALAPARVRTQERAVVAIPHGKPASVQAIEDPICGPALTALAVVLGVELGQGRHRQRVEAPAVACPPDRARERREHLVLPAEVILLRDSVADPEMGRVGADAPERAVAEASAENDLPLIVGELVILDGDKH